MNTKINKRQTYNYKYKFTNTNIDRSVAQPGAQVSSADPRKARLRQRHRHPGGHILIISLSRQGMEIP